jgi:hypothetical protein
LLPELPDTDSEDDLDFEEEEELLVEVDPDLEVEPGFTAGEELLVGVVVTVLDPELFDRDLKLSLVLL